jgi:hypothetical protein
MRRFRSLPSLIAAGVLCTLVARTSAAQTYQPLGASQPVASGNLSHLAYDDKHNVYLFVHENGSYTQVIGRFIDGNGNQVGAEFPISTNAVSFAVRPKVTYSRGNANVDAFFVTYSADQATPGSANVFGQIVRFNGSGGSLVGGTIPVSVNSMTPRNVQLTGDVAFNTVTGKFLVAFENASAADVYVRLFNADGSAASSDIPVIAGKGSQGAATVAYDWQRNVFMVVASGDNPLVADQSGPWGWGVLGALLDGFTGTPISALALLQAGNNIEAAVTYLPERGGFLTAWTAVTGGPRTSNARFMGSTDTQAVLPDPVFVAQYSGLSVGAPRMEYDYVSRFVLMAGMRDLGDTIPGVIGGTILNGSGAPMTGLFNMSNVPAALSGTYYPTVRAAKGGVIAFSYVNDYATGQFERLLFPAAANPGPTVDCTSGCPPPPPPPDADGDGVPDYQDACPSIFAQTANGCPPTPVGGDFTGDSKPELTWQNAITSGQVYSWFLSPNLTFAGGTFLIDDPSIPSGVGWTVVGTSDFSGDGKADLLWQNTLNGQVKLFIMNGATKVGEQPITTNLVWKIVATGDMNNDGHADIVWQNFATGQVYVWYMTSSGGVASFFNPFQGSYLVDGNLNVVTLGPNSPWRVVGTGDINGDGKRDLIWQSNTTGSISAWYLQGTVLVGFSPDVNINDPNWKIRAVGDYNLDTHPDLIFQNVATGDIAAFLLNGATLLQNVPVGRVSLVWTVVGAK